MNWKTIPGYETKRLTYEASDCGKIRSVSRKTGITRELSQHNRLGYRGTNIAGKTISVHILIALAHIQKPNETDDTWTVDHINNEDKMNNNVSNLRWASKPSQVYNRRTFERSGNISCPVIATHIISKEILQFDSLTDAEVLPGVQHELISKCLNKTRKKHAGYTWKTPEISPDLPGEIWKLWNTSTKFKIYFSNCGRIAYEFRHGYIKKVSSQDKNTNRNNDELGLYPRFNKNGKSCQFHNIVYELFVGPIPKDMVVHHKNNNKQMAFVDNLQLVTRSKNTLNAHDDGCFDGTKVERVAIEIDGVQYESYNDAGKKLYQNPGLIWNRVNSINYPEYIKK